MPTYTPTIPCGAGQADDLQQHHHSDHGGGRIRPELLNAYTTASSSVIRLARIHGIEPNDSEEHRRNGNNIGSKNAAIILPNPPIPFEVLQKMPLTWQTHIRYNSA